MPDDLVQQLDPARVRELEAHIRRHFEADGAPAMTYRNIARAVLASGLVVPVSDVLNLAQQHGDSETAGRCICGFWMVESTAEHIRAELRALTQREPR